MGMIMKATVKKEHSFVKNQTKSLNSEAEKK